jgi:16S rRNA (cytosine967-C5)-methyltransferase
MLVQDEGAQLVAIAVGAREGDRLLDVCAAPGGKATLLARTVGAAGMVVAGDHRPARVALLAETIRRAGVRAAVVALDGERPLPFRATFDRVLLDVPCSGLGVVRRDPDIKWNRTAEDLPAFAAAQRRMIRHAADSVKPGGVLMYATCSSEPEENEQVVHDFLQERVDFSIDPIELPSGLVAPNKPQEPPLVDASGFLVTRPDRHQLDAYFAARLVRRNAA